MWSYNFAEINPEKFRERIVVNAINFGNWKHWQWLANYYGAGRMKKIIEGIAESEFRHSALALAKLIFDVKQMKYANRGDKIRAEKNT